MVVLLLSSPLLTLFSPLFSQLCARPPTLSFTFDSGKSWPVRAVDMNLGKTSYGSKRCVGAVAGIDVGLGHSTWILGGAFMVRSRPAARREAELTQLRSQKNVYTVFDPARNAVVFAALA